MLGNAPGLQVLLMELGSASLYDGKDTKAGVQG